MAQNWRTVRVFISSTFHDMHAERDHFMPVAFDRSMWCNLQRIGGSGVFFSTDWGVDGGLPDARKR